jgi:hypothetical protein
MDVARATGAAARRDSMESQRMVGRGHKAQGEKTGKKRGDGGEGSRIQKTSDFMAHIRF